MSLIFLIGYMGCGKSTLAKKLASKLSFEWLDTDAFIEKQEGLTISQIFTTHGESYFRSLELKLIQSIDVTVPTVISTGGGLPCFNNLMEQLNGKGTTIYLERSPKELFQRLNQGKSKRPLIANKSDEELLRFIEENLVERNPIYRQSKYILDRDYQTVDKIINLLNQ
jgi:shikimate kinase